MKPSSKPKEFKFTFAVLFRLIIFFVILGFTINYISSSKANIPLLDPTVLGDESTLNSLYQQLPENSRFLLENYTKTPSYHYLQSNIELLKKEANGFPQKQINEIKKEVINSIYKDLMKNIDSPT